MTDEVVRHVGPPEKVWIWATANGGHDWWDFRPAMKGDEQLTRTRYVREDIYEQLLTKTQGIPHNEQLTKLHYCDTCEMGFLSLRGSPAKCPRCYARNALDEVARAKASCEQLVTEMDRLRAEAKSDATQAGDTIMGLTREIERLREKSSLLGRVARAAKARLKEWTRGTYIQLVEVLEELDRYEG